MTTSGTTAFDMDFTEIAEEAWERAGKEMRSGYELATARRSMNLMTIEWQNRGLNMWTIDSATIACVASQADYDLPADTIDVLECAIRTGSGSTQTDTNIARVSVPSTTDYTIVYWRMRRMEDAGRGIQTADVVFRFYPAMVAGLAYHIAMKVPELMPRVQMLKQVYDEQFHMAASEDREKATWRLVPRGMRV